MIAKEPWYWKYTDEYGVYNEYQELIGLNEEAPLEARKAFAEDYAREQKWRKEFEAKGSLIG